MDYERNEVKIILNIKKIQLSVRFPCTLSFQLKSDQISSQGNKTYELIGGTSTPEEIICLNTEITKRNGRIQQKRVYLNILMISQKGKIPAGNVSISLIDNNTIEACFEEEKTEKISKCPDKNAMIHYSLTVQVKKSEKKKFIARQNSLNEYYSPKRFQSEKSFKSVFNTQKTNKNNSSIEENHMDEMKMQKGSFSDFRSQNISCEEQAEEIQWKQQVKILSKKLLISEKSVKILEKKVDEMRDFEEDLEKKKKQNKQLKQELEKDKGKIEEFKQKLLSEEKKTIFKESSLKDEILKLTNKCKQFDLERKKAVYELNDLITVNQELEKKKNEQMKEKNLAFFQQKSNLMKLNETLNQKIEEISKESEELKKEVQDCRSGEKSQITEKSLEMSSQIQNDKEKIKQMQCQIEKLIKDNRKNQGQINQLKEVEELAQKLKKQNASLKKQNHIINEKNKMLLQKISGYERKMMINEENEKKIMNSKGDLMEKILTLNKTNSVLEKENLKNMQTIKVLSEKLQNKEHIFQKEISQLNKKNEQNLHSLTNSIQKLQQEIEAAQKKLQIKQNVILTKDKENVQMNKENEKLKKQIEAKQLTIAKNVTELLAKQTKKQELSREQEILIGKMNQLDQELIREKKESQEQRVERQKLVQDYRSMENELNEIINNLEEKLQTKNSQFEFLKDQYEKEKKKMNREIEELEKDKEKLLSQCASLQNQTKILLKVNDEKIILLKKVQEKEKEVENVKNLASDENFKAEKLKNELSLCLKAWDMEKNKIEEIREREVQQIIGYSHLVPKSEAYQKALRSIQERSQVEYKNYLSAKLKSSSQNS